MPVSQEKRLRIAVEAMRTQLRFVVTDEAMKPLNAADRSAFAKRIIAHQWFRRTFNMQRFAWSPTWKGDQITVLHELAHYLVPRALWATPRSKGEAWVRRETAFSFVALMQHVYGREAAKVVRALLTENGVKHRPRRIMTAEQKAALVTRGFGPKKRVLAKAATVPGRRRISFEDE